jgi:aspartate 1-decarboxylase
MQGAGAKEADEMLRRMLRAKIHQATVTDVNLEYDGSLTIPADLMEKLGILSGEQVEVANLQTGARLTTYAIRGRRAGRFQLNGAAARCGLPGDRIIVMVFGLLEDEAARRHRPLIAKLGPDNRLRRLLRLRA